MPVGGPGAQQCASGPVHGAGGLLADTRILRARWAQRQIYQQAWGTMAIPVTRMGNAHGSGIMDGYERPICCNA